MSDSHLLVDFRYFRGSRTVRSIAPNQIKVNFNCGSSLLSGLVQRISAFSPSTCYVPLASFLLSPCILVCMPLPPTASGDHLQRRDSGGPLTIGLRVEPAVFSTSKESRRVKTVPLQDTPRKALCGHGLDGTTHLVNSHSRFLCAYFFWSRFRLSGQLLILWDLNNYAAERTVYDNTEYISVLTGSSFCAGLMFSKGQPTPNSLLRAERWEPWSDMRRYVRQLLWGTVCLFHALFLNG